MSKVIEAIYENGVFRPLEPVTLPEGEHVEVRVPEVSPTPHERLEALEAFEAIREELTEEQWEAFDPTLTPTRYTTKVIIDKIMP